MLRTLNADFLCRSYWASCTSTLTTPSILYFFHICFTFFQISQFFITNQANTQPKAKVIALCSSLTTFMTEFNINAIVIISKTISKTSFFVIVFSPICVIIGAGGESTTDLLNSFILCRVTRIEEFFLFLQSSYLLIVGIILFPPNLIIRILLPLKRIAFQHSRFCDGITHLNYKA